MQKTLNSIEGYIQSIKGNMSSIRKNWIDANAVLEMLNELRAIVLKEQIEILKNKKGD